MTTAMIGRYFAQIDNQKKILLWSLISGAFLLLLLGGYGLFAHRILGGFILAADVWFTFRIVKMIRKKGK